MSPSEILSCVSQERLQRDLFALCRDPFTFRTVSYTAPWHEKNSLDEADEWLSGVIGGISGVQLAVKPNRVQAFRCSFDPSIPRCRWYARPRPEDPWHDARNLVATLVGTEHPEEVIYLLAHKDSQSWINGVGALDNATGTVALLELLRVLATLPRKRTLRFLFCNEEHSPWHSADEAQEARERGDRVVAVLNVDSLCGVSEADRLSKRRLFTVLSSTPEGRPLARFVCQAAREAGVPLEYVTGERGVGDDDGCFVKAGFLRAVVCQGSHPYADEQYHLPGDVPERVDPEYLWLSAQAVLAAVLALDEEGVVALEK